MAKDTNSTGNAFGKVKLQDFLAFVRLWDGDTLETKRDKKPFLISKVAENRISVTPGLSGKPRKVDPERYLKIYNKSGSLKTTDYNDPRSGLRNASYFVAIMTEYIKPQNRLLFEDANSLNKETAIPKTEREAVIQARLGQGKFRNKLLGYWGSACSVTKMSNRDLLRASHIKPWGHSDNSERLDKSNGLLLTPNLDAMFDKGLVTFQDNGTIKIARKISNGDLKKLGVGSSMSIRKNKITAEHKIFLAYHRENIFRNT